MSDLTIAIIGAGNMGMSIIGGLISNGHPADKLWISDINTEKLHALKQKFHLFITEDNNEAIKNADIVVLATKPQHLAEVLTKSAAAIHQKQALILSIAAGVRIHSIQEWLGEEIAIVRCMPNTPALIGCGASALYANQYVTPEQHNAAESIMRALGIAVWLKDETLLDTVTALSGSGPAYFFLVMEALQAAAEKLGLTPEIAKVLTLQTALGAAKMALESEESLHQLREQVTSPGGTTERGVAVLEEKGIRDILLQTLEAAKHRSEELAELLSHK